MTQDELAAAIGTDRRNIHRWEVEGHDPGGSVLLQLLTALGVTIEPPPPATLPGALNTEIRELRREIREARDDAASRQGEILSRLEAQEEALRLLAAGSRSRRSQSE